jgi:hypothetical protein
VSGLSREQFEALLDAAVERTVEVAQRDVAEPLPPSRRYRLRSFGFDDEDLSLDAIADLLYFDGTFPPIVDVSVRGIAGDATLIWLIVPGYPWTSELEQTWNDPPGSGPFKSLGLILPGSTWSRPRPLHPHDLQVATAPALNEKLVGRRQDR